MLPPNFPLAPGRNTVTYVPEHGLPEVAALKSRVRALEAGRALLEEKYHRMSEANAEMRETLRKVDRALGGRWY